MSDPVKFIVGGAVQAGGGTYLPRPADEELLDVCLEREFAYILAARQIGKSSLMNESARRLEQEGIKTARIDLSSIGTLENADRWYFSLIDELSFKLRLKVSVEDWWNEKPAEMAGTARFRQFLRDVVLQEIEKPIVIFIDEIDFTLGLNFTDDFFGAIRAIYNERAQYQPYERLTFVLLGVATPSELIKENKRTPFNIGHRINLGDFAKKECAPFQQALQDKYPDQGDAYFDQIFAWTRGHPYLTQKLCNAVLNVAVDDGVDLVDAQVKALFLSSEEQIDYNVQFVRDRVTSDPFVDDMLLVYQQVLQDDHMVSEDSQSLVINKLLLYGLVVTRSGYLQVRNKIYEAVFNQDWIEETQQALESSRKGVPTKYKILQPIVRDGKDIVYLAQRQVAGQAQSVAVKVRNFPENIDIDLDLEMQRLRQIARLNHPNIIPILEVGPSDKHSIFIAMEYAMPNFTLRDQLKEDQGNHLSVDKAMLIIQKIGQALNYAHEKAIIHGDIRPRNILWQADANPSEPILTDFALASFLRANEDNLSQNHMIAKQQPYLAPELWTGQPATVASDIYALAITFYELVSGQRPFNGQLLHEPPKQPIPSLAQDLPIYSSYLDPILQRATTQDPKQRYPSVAEFVKALSEAKQQADEAEEDAKLKRVNQLVQATRIYMEQIEQYQPQVVLAMFEEAFVIKPNHPDALRLRGEIQFEQKRYDEALADYRLAYEQTADLASEAGQDYLTKLNQVAEIQWRMSQQPEAVKHYETIRSLLHQETPAVAKTRLVEFYHQVGVAAFESAHADQANTETIVEAIEQIETQVQALENLEAEAEQQDLGEKLRYLKIQKYKSIIEAERLPLDQLNAKETQIRFSTEAMFQHYANIDEAYRNLIELEPENGQWAEARLAMLRRQVASQVHFAKLSQDKSPPDYEAAIRHYKAILDLEEQYEDLDSGLNLHQLIEQLEVEADHEGKYEEISHLMQQREYAQALDHLERSFIREGNYSYRSVAKLFWVLTHAKNHGGQFPTEWNIMFQISALEEHMVETEKARLQKIRTSLDPWAYFSEMLNKHHNQINTYRKEAKTLETALETIKANEVPDIVGIVRWEANLRTVTNKIESQPDVLVEVNAQGIAAKVDAWRDQIDKLEFALAQSMTVEDRLQVLRQCGETLSAIENDHAFAILQNLGTTNIEIEQMLADLKVQLPLISTISQALEQQKQDEASLTNLQDELRQLRHQFAQSQQESHQARVDLTKSQDHASKVEAKLVDFEAQVQITEEKLSAAQEALTNQTTQQAARNRRFGRLESNRVGIPIALLLAVLAGSVVAPRLESMPAMPVVGLVAFVLLVGYFIYYLWVYYFS